MKIFGTALLFTVGTLAVSEPAVGQATGTDASAMAALQARYSASFAGSPLLYNGPEYLDYAKRYHARVGHQFFLSAEQQAGSVYYNDHLFPALRLAYDVVRDQVVLSPPTSPLTLRLINEKVGSFDVDGHHFIRLVADSLSGGVLRTGYYEVLVDGGVQVLAKRVKRMQERVVQSHLDVEFTATDKVFIKQAGAYYLVKTKGQALRRFADRAKEMQQFMQAQKLVFRRGRFEAAVVQLARYYGSLPPR